MQEIVGYSLAVLVGISLGLIGSGGSILTVPILVYILGIDPVVATAYSLFVVGTTAMVGSVKNVFQRMVDFRIVALFGIPSLVAVYFNRAYVLPLIPDLLFSVGQFQVTKSVGLMVFFSAIMIMASIAMIRPNKDEASGALGGSPLKYNYSLIPLVGLSEGMLTGLVGAGGGFLIVPALVLLAGMPMKRAVSTSLFIVAVKSLLGFTGDLQGNSDLDWGLVVTFTGLAVSGIFIGLFLSKKIAGSKLKTAFGWFVLVMGVYILLSELL